MTLHAPGCCSRPLEERARSHEPVPVDMAADDSCTPAYLGSNPTGKVTTPADVAFAVAESCAILFRFAEDEGTQVWSEDRQMQARAAMDAVTVAELEPVPFPVPAGAGFAAAAGGLQCVFWSTPRALVIFR
jgi:glutathione S-transferase